MKLIRLIKDKNPSLSFEVFPPKNSDAYEVISGAARSIAKLSPGFMSVTYGAGGGTSDYTASIAADLQKECHIPVLAHLSCINASRDDVIHQLSVMKSLGIDNVLALRGDLPSDSQKRERHQYRYASELVAEIKDFGGFCIGGACYPEMHTESRTQKEDLRHLKEKVEAGCEFFTTQMFFDNSIYYNFLYKLREATINVPVIAGIMPVINAAQIKRIVSLSGASLPQRFRYILDRFGEYPQAMVQAGIAYATEQIIDLYANGVRAVHVYSMNNAFVAEKIWNNLSEIISAEGGCHERH